MNKILFLHHSTGWNVWLGKTNKYIYKLTGKGDVSKFLTGYSKKSGKELQISERFFPKTLPYGWKNYPYDYYNIWVRHAGNEPFKGEPTLEILTGQYDMIIFKHCYPGSNILPDTGRADINSEEKRLENYKLQYNALKEKMHQFPGCRFIIWTPAVNVRKLMSEEEAERTRIFHDWIVNEWNEKGDNIYVWDFYGYETDGGLYLAEKNAVDPGNSHPNREFSAFAAGRLGQFIIDVLEGKAE